MRLALIIDPMRARQWHRRLVEALRSDGHQVSVAAAEAGDADRRLSAGIAFITEIEHHLYRIAADHPTAALTGASLAALCGGPDAGALDCTIDLAGTGTVGPALVPLFDGSPDELAAAAAVIDGGSPQIALGYRHAGERELRPVALARPAIEDRTVLTRAMDDVAIGTMRLVRQAVRRMAAGRPLAEVVADQPSRRTSAGAPGFALSGIAAKLTRRLTRLVTRPDHWRVGWRWTNGDAVRDRLAWPDASYTFLADDRQRYFADPFVFAHEGVAHVFCEEYPYASRKGVISVFTVAPDGSTTTPRPVLERPYHLSYPFVFAEAGAIWMIPETSGNRTVELFRAERFPDVWVREAVLVADVVAADATLVTHAGRRWLFATLADDGGSSWDALGLYHAPDLMGRWRPHHLNPVTIDAGAARPAGMMFSRGDRLLRPAQDCTGGYGSALTLCEVTRLDVGGYEQRTVARLTPPVGWRSAGVHTLNEAGGLEVIDCVGPRRRF